MIFSIYQSWITSQDNRHADLSRGGQERPGNRTRNLVHARSARQLQVLLAGGLINFIRQRS